MLKGLLFGLGCGSKRLVFPKRESELRVKLQSGLLTRGRSVFTTSPSSRWCPTNASRGRFAFDKLLSKLPSRPGALHYRPPHPVAPRKHRVRAHLKSRFRLLKQVHCCRAARNSENNRGTNRSYLRAPPKSSCQ